jgi:hypothetical protein
MKSHADSIPDRLILAAIDRAIRHRGGERHAITGSVYEHLAVRSRSGAARHVHQRLLALEEAEAVERSSRHGFIAWGLTRNGRRRLNRTTIRRCRAARVAAAPRMARRTDTRRRRDRKVPRGTTRCDHRSDGAGRFGARLRCAIRARGAPALRTQATGISDLLPERVG